MRSTHLEIDDLYSGLKIHNEDIIPNNKLNLGSMDRKLNTDCSTIVGDKKDSTWSNSTRLLK